MILTQNYRSGEMMQMTCFISRYDFNQLRKAGERMGTKKPPVAEVLQKGHQCLSLPENGVVRRHAQLPGWFSTGITRD
jgi:hypothetical protein